MNYIEFVGRTAEDAVRQACKELQTSKEKLKYDVISFGSTGIFGLVGSKKAKIRVHSLDSYPKRTEKQSSRINEKNDTDKTLDNRSSKIDEPSHVEEQKNRSARTEDESSRSSPSDEKFNRSSQSGDQFNRSSRSDEEAPYRSSRSSSRSEEAPYRSSSRFEKSNRPSRSDNDRPYRDTDPDISTESEDIDIGDPNDPLLSDEFVQKGYEALKKLVESITDDVTVSCGARDNQVFFHVQGGNTAVLIGKHGQTLEAMQFLIDKIINKNRFKQKVRIRIDIEGYLRVREENLKNMALRYGEKVIKTKRPETIGPMNAHDRRIVHLTLKSENRLKTQSIGSGYYRKLVIFPYRGRTHADE